MGAPGSGKGTLAGRIVKDYGLKHFSSGDLMRKHIADKTRVSTVILSSPSLRRGTGNLGSLFPISHALRFPSPSPSINLPSNRKLLPLHSHSSQLQFPCAGIGMQLKPYMDKGALVPDELACRLVLAGVTDIEHGGLSWLLDGSSKPTIHSYCISPFIIRFALEHWLVRIRKQAIIALRLMDRYLYITKPNMFYGTSPKLPGWVGNCMLQFDSVFYN